MKTLINVNTHKPVVHFDTMTPVEIPDRYTSKPFRAWWVSNVVNIDLPTTDDAKDYQRQVIRMLDEAKKWQMTAIFFQVRTTNDAFYASKLNPYSRYLTGKEGKEPPMDMLRWIIKETHQRGIEFHAWMNPYRVSVNGTLSKKDYLDTCDDLNFAKRNPEMVLVDQKGILILNPAHPAVHDHIDDSIRELIHDYPVDGIHFDDYFYPYAGLIEGEGDEWEYEAFKTTDMSLEDFRRAQVNGLIKRLHESIKSINSALRFGMSPFGIWKNKADDPRGSNTHPTCGQCYHQQFADPVAWIETGSIDYIVPQIYFGFSHDRAPFADLVDWWAGIVKGSGVDLYIGHGPYRLGVEKEYGDPAEVAHQVMYANQYPEVNGNVFFTYNTFIKDGKAKPGIDILHTLLIDEVTP